MYPVYDFSYLSRNHRYDRYNVRISYPFPTDGVHRPITQSIHIKITVYCFA